MTRLASTALVAILLHILTPLATVAQRGPQGVFELKLKKFLNPTGKDSQGNCCEGYRNTNDHQCSGQCATKFRVCLKHFQNKIDHTRDCTFGEQITSVVGHNSMEITNQPIEFEIDFKWPGTFSLIVEAWHENSLGQQRSGSNQTLISRLMMSHPGLDAGLDWTPEAYSQEDSKLEFEYRVKCSHHYYGKSCDILCKPRDDNFGHYECGADGDKICLPGWQKDSDREYCTKPECAAGCHETNGYCTEPGTCKCHEGWQGYNCDTCITYPGCVHGSCSGPFTCECEDGWGGLLCNKDLNYCTNHKPCMNGATCFNTGEKLYTCSCPIGFVGEHCETRVTNKCQENPCRNGGVCKGTSSGDEYTCQCPNGFQGHHCEFNEGFDQCSGSPCENGATCISTSVSYQCTCPPGFEGRNCEINSNDCEINPCQNGGTCFDFVNDYKCFCPYGFIGQHCEENYDDCKNYPCANGGTCSDGVNDFTCSCKPGFTGKDCSVEINECDSVPCLNEGFCIDGNNTFTCRCLPRYSGDLCEIRPDGSIDPAYYQRVTGAEPTTGPDDTGNMALVGTFSALVPLVVIVAAVVLVCMKQRRKMEQRRADFEAQMENELNAVNSINKSKMLDDHMIVNSLDYPKQKCVNTNPNIADEDLFTAKDSAYAQMSRTKSTKQLNTDSALNRASMLCDKLDNEYEVKCSNRTNSALLDKSRLAKTKSTNLDISSSTLCSGASLSSSSEKSCLTKKELNIRDAAYNAAVGPASCGSASPAPSSVYTIDSNNHLNMSGNNTGKCFTDDLLATEV